MKNIKLNALSKKAIEKKKLSMAKGGNLSKCHGECSFTTYLSIAIMNS